ncbi:hypothetical protein O3M35_003139 [Rhynocoris fuscipes]|uniref:Transmembrane protein 267 n=1 Tax=Rhynocoris fuscipes TaxID=488301 RepID=A0AAW1CI20_9HEMI
MLCCLILTFSICLTALLGDAILNVIRLPISRAFTDSLTHGLIGLITWIVVVQLYRGKFLVSKTFEVILSGFIASAIDVDHFIYNRSFDINEALHLGEHRPIFHSTSLLIVSTVVPYIFSLVYRIFWLNRLSWIILVSGMSHHIRDATRRGLWFYPIGSTKPLPKYLYIALLGILPHASFYLDTYIGKKFQILHKNTILRYIPYEEV